MKRNILLLSGIGAIGFFGWHGVVLGANPAATSSASEGITQDWNQWAGSPQRNNTPVGQGIPSQWEIGDVDPETGQWDATGAQNVKWVVPLGSQSYGNPVVADGRVYVGTNNMRGYIERYPPDVDLGVLLCFDADDGRFLWQHSSEKLPTGRVHDWPYQGICCAPLVEGKRLWFVTSRGEVRCLDAEGFHDEENDGPFTEEAVTSKDEADVIWSLDMMSELGVSQHNMASCSVTAVGDTLFVNTSNGVDEAHKFLPAPNAPSFIAVDKNTGKVLWTDNAPGQNILHGQWSSPAYGVFEGQPQVIFAGGDGWVYSYDPAGDGKGNAKLLWKFDANPKRSFYTVSGEATRNHIIGTPVVYEGLIYVGVGEDPEHMEGEGHLWCINPVNKGGDVSPEVVYNSNDPDTPIPHKRLLACDEEAGDFTRPNPNSAVVWHYFEDDWNGDGEIDDFAEKMHRTIGSVAIKDDVLYIADFSGLFHCLDAKTGKVHWTYDMLAQSWGSPLIVDGKVYIGDEDGDIAIFRHSPDPQEAMKDDGGEMVPFYGEINLGAAVYSTPIVAGNVLYVSNQRSLFAIAEGAEPVSVATAAGGR
jgi:outer membrane protein assembly factor BamB